MKRFFFCLTALTLMTCYSLAEPEKAVQDVASPLKEMRLQWRQSSNSDGLKLYWAKVEGSQVIAFKGEGIVDAPIDKVASIIVDTTRATEWIDSLVSSKVVRQLPASEFIEYDHVGIMFPFDTVMSDRDFVSHVFLQGDPLGKFTVSYLPAEDDQAPVLKKYTRGTMTCVFKMTPMSIPEETYVEAEIHCDPRGAVPKWLVNFFQEGWPQTTFQNLRRQAQKRDIQILSVVENLLHKPTVKLAKAKK